MSDPQSLDRERIITGTVLIICPGALENGGGIGRQMGYFLQADPGKRNGLNYRVVDSRGPWFLGASPMHVGLSLFYLAGAVITLLAARLGAAPCLAHVNITGRGSTVRKTILLTFARMFGTRYLLHVHDPDYAEEYRRRGAFMQSMIAGMFRGATKVLVLGNREREALATAMNLPHDLLAVLPNAVPDPLSGAEWEQRPDGPCHFLFLGHLSARKGVPELLNALATPALKGRQWRATLAGGGPIEEFRQLASDLGIASRVDFPGWVESAQVRALCMSADVLVLPSHAEGLAMAVLEGLSHGLPVVATPVGAHPEVIESEVSGILVPPGNVEALADALVRLADDPDLRRQLGDRARRHFLEKFDVRNYAQRLDRIHAELLMEHKGGKLAAD